MLIKSADDQSARIAELTRQADAGSKQATEELRIRKAGLKGEAESAYLIDFHFGRTENWAVLHDLRLEIDGRVAQIDHVLMNRMLEIYVLESKHFHAGVKITDDGEFLRWNQYKKTFEGWRRRSRRTTGIARSCATYWRAWTCRCAPAFE